MNKQEKLEEAAENYAKGWASNSDKEAFIDGAKWQAERMYSESQVIILLNKFGSKVYSDYTRNETMEDFTEEWFEQLKKK
jgi:hypothetical protein